ncbi:MAG TPA: hypothetical protein VFS43_10200 [Polyangiaceae bacterium]|nr:hypothetical protein [Polyangiaceae bacterium]
MTTPAHVAPTAFDVPAATDRRPSALWWSKFEILFGLGAAGLGVVWAGEAGACAWLAPGLCSLGGYLALAGHRSHLYDAMVRQTAATLARLALPRAGA